MYCYLLVSALFLAGCTSKNEESDSKVTLPPVIQHKVEVNVESARFGDFRVEILSNGKAFADKISEITFPVNGQIDRVMVRNGDKVSMGQAICHIGDSDLKMQLGRIYSQVDKAIIELDDRLIDFGYRLKDSSKVPPAVLKMAKIKSGYTDAIFSLAETRSLISKTYVRTPFSGKIANLHARLYNQAQSSTSLCTLVDDRYMRVEFKVLASELPAVRSASGVVLSGYGLQKEVEARIIEVSPIVDVAGMIDVVALADNGEGNIISGMEVKVSVVNLIHSTLYVNKDALLVRNNKKVVFTVNNGLAKWNYVTTGLENKNFVMVTSGIDRGDLVVTGNNLSLSDGTRIVQKK